MCIVYVVHLSFKWVTVPKEYLMYYVTKAQLASLLGSVCGGQDDGTHLYEVDGVYVTLMVDWDDYYTITYVVVD
jgi:hypothetical protein